MSRPKVRLHLLKVDDDIGQSAILDFFMALTGRDATAEEIAELRRELEVLRGAIVERRRAE